MRMRLSIKGKSCPLDTLIEETKKIQEIRDKILELKITQEDMLVPEYKKKYNEVFSALEEAKKRLKEKCGVGLSDEQIFGD